MSLRAMPTNRSARNKSIAHRAFSEKFPYGIQVYNEVNYLGKIQN